jgi:hypothetical protein
VRSYAAGLYLAATVMVGVASEAAVAGNGWCPCSALQRRRAESHARECADFVPQEVSGDSKGAGVEQGYPASRDRGVGDGVDSGAVAELKFSGVASAPHIEKACEAVGRVVRDGKRAGEVIAQIRALCRKSGIKRQRLDMNEAIVEVLALAQGEVRTKRVALRTNRFLASTSMRIGDRHSNETEWRCAFTLTAGQRPEYSQQSASPVNRNQSIRSRPWGPNIPLRKVFLRHADGVLQPPGGDHSRQRPHAGLQAKS